MKCNHRNLYILYHFGGQVTIQFSCSKCGAIINKLDNSKRYVIIPNPHLSNAPTKTGVWESKEV